jgi:serine/threonine protein kinase
MPVANPEQSIFLAALELPTPAERAAYLMGACGADPALLANVQELLAAHENGDGFLDRPPPNATVDEQAVTEQPGTVIGPYKLKEQIGEGGMGLVFVAEQQEPVRRKVALKIIKPGMDSKQVIARFEAERQALAMMDHQNIAKVFDAGTTESGRPYFVMELVHGVPITDYCDANKLTPRQRLELFVPVCQAIQHAHQKGIIHRDIKPSNVLVTMYDDKPVPKVIDFGVAKAIEQRLTEKSVYTQFGTLVGTFEYMSPEQAEMNAFGVDTRSDIYALGVLLYELLTGTTPLERPRLREAAFGEIVQLIKEEEPPRPSVRLSTSGALAKVAAERRTDPAKLSRLVRGELDWVVMRCLEKDRTRRYDTASALARDVERYLRDEPVEARPPSAAYRLRKTIRRNRTALSVAGVVAAALLLGTSVAVWQASVARADRQRAEKAENDRIEADAAAAARLKKEEDERLAERRQEKLDRAIGAAFSGDLKTADIAIVEAEKAGVAADQSHWLRGLVHFQRGDYDAAIKEFNSSLALKPTVAAQAMLARAYIQAGLQSGGNQLDYEYPQALAALHSMKAVTAEDYMCRGFARPMYEREERLSDRDKAVAMRDSPIARTIRGLGVATAGLESRDLKLLEGAIKDLRTAKLRMGDNPFVRSASANTLMPAAILYGEAGLPDKRKDLLEEAKADVDLLKDIWVSEFVRTRVNYLQLEGNDDAALAILKEAATREETKDLVWLLAMTLYGKDQVEQALEVLHLSRKPENAAVQVLRVFLMAEHPRYGPDKAYEEYQKLTRQAREKGRPLLHRDAAMVLLFLGKRSEAAEALREGTDQSNLGGIKTSTLAEYVGGSISEEKFLKDGKAGSLAWCIQHHLIGLVRLSQGDREGAGEHFQESFGTMWRAYSLNQYSRVFRERLKHDPKWPRWIDPKK